MKKVDDISAEVDDFKEAMENKVEGCDGLKVKTETGEGTNYLLSSLNSSSSNFSGSVLTFLTSQVLDFSTSEFVSSNYLQSFSLVTRFVMLPLHFIFQQYNIYNR